MKKSLLYILPVVCLVSCIEPYDYHLEEKNNYLVVEGAISTACGPHWVQLTTTRNASNTSSKYKLYVEKAQVRIINGSGEDEILTETQPGNYYTSDSYRGVGGETYLLEITTSDGKVYRSGEETLHSLPQLDSLSLAFGTTNTLSDYNSVLETPGFFISAWMQNTGNAGAYRVRWDYTYKVTTKGDAPNNCWVLVVPPTFELFTEDLAIEGSRFEQPLFFLPVRGVMFAEKIHVRATITSISPAAMRFWQGVYNNLYAQGGVFDPPPAGIASNIVNVHDPGELVLGYFYAADTDTLATSIYARDFPLRVDTEIDFSIPCDKYPTEKYSTISTFEPEYWTE